MGIRGVHPLCFLKSVQVVANERFGEARKTGVCRRLKGKQLEEGACSKRKGEFTKECSAVEKYMSITIYYMVIRMKSSNEEFERAECDI